MENRPPSFTKPEVSIPVSELRRQSEGWLLAGDIDQHSERTLGARRDIVGKLFWYLRSRECPDCGTHELRQFLAYLTHGHKEPGGRWGNPKMTKPVSPRTVH